MFTSVTKRKTEDTAIDTINAVLGVCLALAPWVLGFTDNSSAAWNAWIVGAAMALVAIGALVSFAEWEEWVNLALGLWTVIAPWALGFAGLTYALYAHVIIGLVAAALAAVELWRVHYPTTSAA